MARPKKGNELGASATIGLRVPPDMRAAIEAEAERHNRSLTDEVRELIMDGLKSRQGARGVGADHDAGRKPRQSRRVIG